MIFLLPALPIHQHYNFAYWGVAGLLLIALLVLDNSKQEQSLMLSDLGLLLLGGCVLFPFFIQSISSSTIPVSTTYANWLLLPLAYFVFVKGRFFQNRYQQLSNIFLTLFIIGALYVGYHAHQVHYQYGPLTVALNYGKGLGNISQWSMYFSFLLIVGFYTTKNLKAIAFLLLLSLPLVALLHSKLLLLVAGILFLGKLMEKRSLQKNIALLSILLIGGGLSLFLITPASL